MRIMSNLLNDDGLFEETWAAIEWKEIGIFFARRWTSWATTSQAEASK